MVLVKYSVNEAFFETWSPSMAYVLGFLFSDGSMEDAPYIRGKYIRVSSTDLDRITLIRSLLCSRHTIVKSRKSNRHKPQFLLRIGSKKLFDSLVVFGMTPRKSMTMRFPTVPTLVLPFFILGYFDGDGCVYVSSRNPARPTRLKTIFTSGSKKFLEKLQSILANDACMVGGGVYTHGSTKGTFQLCYTARDSMRLYLFMYKNREAITLALKRKYAIFTRYFKGLDIKESDFQAILMKKGPVVKG